MKKTAVVSGLAAIGVLIAGFLLYGRIAAQPAGDHNDHDGHRHDAAQPAGDHNDHDGHGRDAAEAKPAGAAVEVTPEQRRLIGLRVEPAREGELDNTIRLSGEIRLNLDETARIMPRMPGFVAAIDVREGDVVEKGRVLARLVSQKLGTYNADFKSASELEKLARSDSEMAGRLRANDAISEKEYLRYKHEYANTVIARQRAETMLRALAIDPPGDAGTGGGGHCAAGAGDGICTDYEIRSPLSGTVIGKNITPGENFAEDNETVIFTVSNLKRLRLDLRAAAPELRLLKVGMPVTATTLQNGGTFRGDIAYISPVIDETTRTALVRVLLDNPDGRLRPGEFASAEIGLPAGARSVLVPRDAVQLIDGETGVFVPRGDGFELRRVRIGRTANGLTRILDGLRAGEPYVSAGAFELKSILLTGGMDPHAGHGH